MFSGLVLRTRRVCAGRTAMRNRSGIVVILAWLLGVATQSYAADTGGERSDPVDPACRERTASPEKCVINDGLAPPPPRAGAARGLPALPPPDTSIPGGPVTTVPTPSTPGALPPTPGQLPQTPGAPPTTPGQIPPPGTTPSTPTPVPSIPSASPTTPGTSPSSAGPAASSAPGASQSTPRSAPGATGGAGAQGRSR
jgi:hypothetical protein